MFKKWLNQEWILNTKTNCRITFTFFISSKKKKKVSKVFSNKMYLIKIICMFSQKSGKWGSWGKSLNTSGLMLIKLLKQRWSNCGEWGEGWNRKYQKIRGKNSKICQKSCLFSMAKTADEPMDICAVTLPWKPHPLGSHTQKWIQNQANSVTSSQGTLSQSPFQFMCLEHEYS